MYELGDWRMRNEEDGWVLRGTMHGDSALDTQQVTTSPIKNAQVEGDALVFQTQDSTYRCPFEEARFVERLRALPEIPEAGISADGVEAALARIQDARDRAERQAISELEALLPAGAKDAVVIEFDAGAPYYFKRLLSWYEGSRAYYGPGSEYVNVGTFQDSVLLGEFEGAEDDELRYFPYRGNRLKFYNFPGRDTRIFLANSASSDAPIEVDTPRGKYLIPAGACCEAGSDEASDLLIDEPTVPPIDKYSLHEAEVAEGLDAVAYGRLSAPVKVQLPPEE